MPYITQGRRKQIDHIVETMADADITANGDLNYILYRYAKCFIPPSYNSYKNYLGELNEAAEEIRRRILAPYEDGKIQENGDI